MIITCEKCKTQYTVPAKIIKEGGKKVRCSNCTHTWLQMPLNKHTEDKGYIDIGTDNSNPSNAIPAPPEQKVNEIPEESNLPIVHKAKIVPRSFKYTLAAALILAAVISIFAYPNKIRDIYAEIDGLYNLIGLNNTKDIALKHFTVDKTHVDKKLQVVLRGYVVNGSSEVRIMPKIVLTAYRKNGAVLVESEIDPPQEFLNPLEEVYIRPEIEEIPDSADKVVLNMGNSWELYFKQ